MGSARDPGEFPPAFPDLGSFTKCTSLCQNALSGNKLHRQRHRSRRQEKVEHQKKKVSYNTAQTLARGTPFLIDIIACNLQNNMEHKTTLNIRSHLPFQLKTMHYAGFYSGNEGFKKSNEQRKAWSVQLMVYKWLD